MLIKKRLNIVTPLCPDYEHVKIGEGLYKYTFNKLGDGLGLIGKRLISILNKINTKFWKKMTLSLNISFYMEILKLNSENL